jgi:hypothetical protein
MSHKPLLDASVSALLVFADREIAAEVRAAGCAACGGTLHSAPYPRRPRGGPPPELLKEYSRRESFCCAEDGCRKRATPASLRFFGRRVYLAPVIVLVSAMTGGVTEKRARRMRDLVGVSVRTLQRWRAWWLRTFPRTAFWKEARSRFATPVEGSRMPTSLLERFSDSPGSSDSGLVACLRFLAPITISGGGTMA